MKYLFYVIFWGPFVYWSYYFYGFLRLPSNFYDWIKGKCKEDGSRICKMCHKYIRKRDRGEIQMHPECWHKMLSAVFYEVCESAKKVFINMAYEFGVAASSIRKFAESMEKLKEDCPKWK